MSLAPVFFRLAGLALLASANGGFATNTLATSAASLSFRKIQLSPDFLAEGGAFGDLNRDGHADAVAGPYWYEGPDFTRRHQLYPPPPPFDPLHYSDNFSAFVHDFNADAWPDVLVIGFPGKEASWLENPGADGGPWRRHLAFEPVANESPTFGDLLGRGQPGLICMSGGRIGYATSNPQAPTKPWTFHAVSPPGPWTHFTHGLGFGDINGDGRADLLEKDGWWEQPASLAGDPIWKKHPAAFGAGGAQMYATDVNGDGRADVVTAHQAHGYGLSWFEQTPETTDDGSPLFREHAITSRLADEKIAGVQFSQPHALALTDLDGDGLVDLLTGKRWWAHGPAKDPEPNAAPVLYAFLLRRAPDGSVSFEPHLIDDASGVGTQLVAADVNADDRPDIITVNKRGAAVYLSSSPRTLPTPAQP